MVLQAVRTIECIRSEKKSSPVQIYYEMNQYRMVGIDLKALIGEWDPFSDKCPLPRKSVVLGDFMCKATFPPPKHTYLAII